MGDVKPSGRRPYNAPRRQARAEESKRRVAACARELFVTRGYAATAVDDIAAAAGVGRRSIYDTFGNKRGILFALLGELAVAEEAELNAAIEASAGDAVTQLRLAIEFVTTLYDRAADLLDMVHAAAGADPDLAAVDAEGERRRLENERPTVADWYRRGLLRVGLSRAQATDILWVMTSPQLYRLFVAERGWPVGAFREWLTSQLVHALLAETVQERKD